MVSIRVWREMTNGNDRLKVGPVEVPSVLEGSVVFVIQCLNSFGRFSLTIFKKNALKFAENNDGNL